MFWRSSPIGDTELKNLLLKNVLGSPVLTDCEEQKDVSSQKVKFSTALEERGPMLLETTKGERPMGCWGSPSFPSPPGQKFPWGKGRLLGYHRSWVALGCVYLFTGLFLPSSSGLLTGLSLPRALPPCRPQRTEK